jgi:hypothetical protein
MLETEPHLSGLYSYYTEVFWLKVALQSTAVRKHYSLSEFQFVKVVVMKIIANWHVMLCSVVEIHTHLEQPVASIFRLKYVLRITVSSHPQNPSVPFVR